MVKKILLILVALLVLIQFFPMSKNDARGPQPNYIGTKFFVPGDVKSILNRACMDCHSNYTEYPWYAKVQPIGFWLNDHVNDGKRHLNFDEFTTRSVRYQYKKLDETIEMVKENEMPLESYTLIHKDANLTQDEKVALTNWAQKIMDEIKANNPPESFEREKKD